MWNEAAAHRLSTLGFAARRGDLVWLQQEERGRHEDGAALKTLPQVTGEGWQTNNPCFQNHFILLSPHQSSLPNHALTNFWELGNAEQGECITLTQSGLEKWGHGRKSLFHLMFAPVLWLKKETRPKIFDVANLLYFNFLTLYSSASNIFMYKNYSSATMKKMSKSICLWCFLMKTYSDRMIYFYSLFCCFFRSTSWRTKRSDWAPILWDRCEALVTALSLLYIRVWPLTSSPRCCCPCQETQ